MNPAEDYRSSHRAPGQGETPLWRLDECVADIYDRPADHHGGDDSATLRAVMHSRNNPDAIIRVFRSVPAGTETINPGDWVSLSEQYATESGYHPTDEAKDKPVIWADVPARTIWWDGNSLQEFGYAP
jgi:hypothetical protein